MIELPPVKHCIVVPMPPAQAFDLFTAGIARWWPFRSHSCAGDDALDVQFEPHVGGAVTEVDRQGRRHAWGVLTAWSGGSLKPEQASILKQLFFNSSSNYQRPPRNHPVPGQPEEPPARPRR